MRRWIQLGEANTFNPFSAVLMAKTLLGCSESVYAWSFNDGADPETPIAPIWVAQPRPGDAGMKVRQFEVVWAPQRTPLAILGLV